MVLNGLLLIYMYELARGYRPHRPERRAGTPKEAMVCESNVSNELHINHEGEVVSEESARVES